MIRAEAGMSTARFCRLIDMPEWTWHRWQAKASTGGQPKRPWPQPARSSARDHVVSEATVLRLLRHEGLILPAHYQRDGRRLAERRKAGFANDPTGPY